jgi:hypothetical protein
MKGRFQFISLLCAAALFSGSTFAEGGTTYTFQQVALSGDEFDPLGFDAPVVNNAGAVAFKARRFGVRGIYRRQGGVLTTMADASGFTRFGSISINDAGQVGFEATQVGVQGEAIFRSSGGAQAPMKIAGTRAAGDFDFVNARPQINESGRVAFIGERIVASNFIAGVYAGDGGLVVPIYDESGPLDSFLGNPSLNDNDVVAFLATRDTGGGGLFLGSGKSTATTIADDTSTFSSVFGFSDPVLNNQGQVAFRAGTTAPEGPTGATGEGIFFFNGSTVTPIFQGTADQFASLGDPALNNAGDVAFVIEPESGNQILVTGPDLVAARVIGSGDTLAGHTVSNLIISREALTDAGQLAFAAYFTDGEAGIFLATPTLELVSAASLKTHSGAGTFAVPLPLTGTPGIECRSGGEGNFHSITFTFTNPLASGNATVTSGTAEIFNSRIVTGNTITVNLTGVSNAQTITITLTNVTDVFSHVLPDTPVRASFLLGDTNANGSVTASDLGQTKSQAGQPVTPANFRTDVNANGAINASDIGSVKSQAGMSLPPVANP